MKKLLVTLFLGATALHAGAQAQAKKYVLLEHFTNSRCSVCASRNPAFYNLIDDYPNDVHHISYHPPIPYNNCVFYLANTSENNGRAAYYGINSSPRVVLNGTLVNGGGSLLPAATLNAALPLTSPIALQVAETSGTNRTATITILTQTAVPAGDYKLYVAVVEKTINMTTPNGESVHHDVFRQMLPAVDGTPVTIPQPGNSASLTFNYTVSSGWNANEVYVVAFIQNTATNEILNSGTRFDTFTLSADEPSVQSVSIQPNPASESAVAFLAGDRAESLEIFALNGSRVSASFENQADGSVSFSLQHLPKGIYVVKILGEKGVYTAKVVKS